MEFALLGADFESCSLVQAAIELGHEVIWIGDIGSFDHSTYEWLADDDQATEWETLYDRHFCDFVIVGRGRTSVDRRAEQIIQLVKSGAAVLTTFPLSDSVLSYYEIDMARAESNAVLWHFNPLVARHKRLDEFADWIQSRHPQLGQIEQLICERPSVVRSRETVMWHFPGDVELLDRIAGPLDRLGALGPPDSEAAYSALNVQLLGKNQVPVRWSICPPDLTEVPSLTFIGGNGRAQFQFDQNGDFALESDQPEFYPASAATACLTEFLAAITDSNAPRTNWPSALRAMELADTIEISLRRGRMIDVHRQQLTEELSFRGTMSAVGCAVLLLLPPLLLLAGWIGEMLGLQFDKNWWAYGLFALLAFFLLFQFAPKLLLKKSDSPP